MEYAIDLAPRALARLQCGYPVETLHGCAHRFLADYSFTGRELVYCDPLYLTSTRSSGRRYRYDYEPEQHIELLGLLTGLPCSVMLSGYPSPRYDEWLGELTEPGTAGDEPGGGAHRETVVQLHPGRPFWIRYAGKNFTDRQRIKRKPSSWARLLPGHGAGGAARGAGGPDGGRGRIGLSRPNKASLRTESDTLKEQFEHLCAQGDMGADSRELFQALLTLFELLMVMFMEERTPKNSRNSGLPPSQTHERTEAQPGSKAKGPDPRHSAGANTRTAETVEILPMGACQRCGIDLSRCDAERHERRTRIDIVFEKMIKHCPHCGAPRTDQSVNGARLTRMTASSSSANHAYGR